MDDEEFVQPEDATYFNDTNMILQQEGCRVTGTFSNGGLIDGNSSGWSEFLDPLIMDFPCNLIGNYSVPEDWNQKLPATNDGKRIYGKFDFTLPKSDVNNLSGRFSGPGIDGRICYGSKIGSTETAPASYELSISPHSEKAQHPLAVVISLKENEKPVSNAKLKIHAFNLPDNDKKLAEYFLVSSCTNCPAGHTTIDGKTISTLCQYEVGLSLPCPLKEQKKPLNITTDANGEARIEFFLPLGKPDAILPSRNSPVTIPILVEYWKTGSDGKDIKVAEKKYEANLNSIAVVQEILYLEPQDFDGNGNKLMRSSAALAIGVTMTG